MDSSPLWAQVRAMIVSQVPTLIRQDKSERITDFLGRYEVLWSRMRDIASDDIVTPAVYTHSFINDILAVQLCRF